MTSELKNLANLFPFVFCLKWNIFSLTCSFMLRFFEKWISNYQWIFEILFDTIKFHLHEDQGRFIWASPKMITQRLTSKCQYRVYFQTFVFIEKWNIFCQSWSFELRIFEKWLSSYEQIFEYFFTKKKFLKSKIRAGSFERLQK